MASVNQKAAIINAVAQVIIRDGLLNTTIDAVAAEAGLSKGGVLYYFPSKRELLDGLIHEYERNLLENRDKLAATLPNRPNRNFKATIMIMLDDMVGHGHQPNFLSVVSDECTRALIGRVKRRVYEEAIASGLPAKEVAMIHYLVDGMVMDMIFNPTVIPAEQRQEIANMIIAKLDEMGQ